MSVTLHPPGEHPQPGAQPQASAQEPRPAASETPSQAVTRKANETRYVTDARGRRIGWRKLSALEDFDLTEIAGANSTNLEWMARASVAFSVREIDGDPVSPPINKAQLRALVARLDGDGMTAIMDVIWAEQEAAEKAAAAERERAKN